jgi:SOS response associated peptidase (SRAP)
VSWKLSRTVLRGAVGGNADRLLDRKSDRQAFRFTLSGDDEIFGVAGLWDAWKSPEGDWLQSFTIITTDPNAVAQTVHNRMLGSSAPTRAHEAP